MKPTLLFRPVLFIVVLALAISCKDGQKSMLPAVNGATNEILVVMNKSLWDGNVGDTVKHWFGQDQVGLPQAEPIFDLLNLPLAMFDKNVKAHRNVLVVEISPDIDSTSITFKESPWASSQKYFRIQAPTEEAFFQLFDANKQKIMAVFLKAERDRLIDVYKKTSDSKIFSLFRDKYHMILYCPAGYNINKDTNNFVWISMETKKNSRGIIFFECDYVNENQFQYEAILDTVNAQLKRYVPGPLENTYMAIDMNLPVNSSNYNYDQTHYAVMMKGLWMVQNDFMAGPFVLNTVLDEKNNRIIYMMGYVYAPDETKRNMLRQVESILFSTELDFGESAK